MRRTLNLVLCTLATLTAATCLAMSTAWVETRWRLWQLDHGSERTRLSATKRLGELGAIEALPRLLPETSPRRSATGHPIT